MPHAKKFGGNVEALEELVAVLSISNGLNNPKRSGNSLQVRHSDEYHTCLQNTIL